MDFHKILAKLTAHPVFKDWHKDNSEYFLAHMFIMLDEANKDTVQVGFYNEKKERMVTFVVSNDIQRIEDQEVLKSKGKIEKLKPEEIKIEADKAIEIATKCFDEHYAGNPIIKNFYIIQHLMGKAVYNVSYFLQSFETVNIKIDASTGEIIKHDAQKLMDFA